MAQEQNPVMMKEKLGNINNMIEECHTHITASNLSELKEASAWLKRI